MLCHLCIKKKMARRHEAKQPRWKIATTTRKSYTSLPLVHCTLVQKYWCGTWELKCYVMPLFLYFRAVALNLFNLIFQRATDNKHVFRPTFKVKDTCRDFLRRVVKSGRGWNGGGEFKPTYKLFLSFIVLWQRFLRLWRWNHGGRVFDIIILEYEIWVLTFILICFLLHFWPKTCPQRQRTYS